MRVVGLLAFLIVLPLAGCPENVSLNPQMRETMDRTPGMGEMNMTKEQKAAKDDRICKGYGAQPVHQLISSVAQLRISPATRLC
jgi:hypothetical protein